MVSHTSLPPHSPWCSFVSGCSRGRNLPLEMGCLENERMEWREGGVQGSTSSMDSTSHRGRVRRVRARIWEARRTRERRKPVSGWARNSSRAGRCTPEPQPSRSRDLWAPLPSGEKMQSLRRKANARRSPERRSQRHPRRALQPDHGDARNLDNPATLSDDPARRQMHTHRATATSDCAPRARLQNAPNLWEEILPHKKSRFSFSSPEAPACHLCAARATACMSTRELPVSLEMIRPPAACEGRRSANFPGGRMTPTTVDKKKVRSRQPDSVPLQA